MEMQAHAADHWKSYWIALDTHSPITFSIAIMTDIIFINLVRYQILLYARYLCSRAHSAQRLNKFLIKLAAIKLIKNNGVK